MAKIKTILTFSLVPAVLLVLSFAPKMALAADCPPNPQTIKEQLECGEKNAAGANPNADATSNLESSIEAIVKVLSIIVGIVAVIMLIVGGLRYVTSAGNEQSVAGAKRTLLYALVGLVIVAVAQLIVRFVLNKVT